MNIDSMSLKQLHELRVKVGREIESREKGLCDLSQQNLQSDLGSDATVGASLGFLMQKAAARGLVLTTTKEREQWVVIMNGSGYVSVEDSLDNAKLVVQKRATSHLEWVEIIAGFTASGHRILKAKSAL